METRDWSFWLILIGLIVLIAAIFLFTLKQRITWWIGLLMAIGVCGLVFGSVLNWEYNKCMKNPCEM